MKKIAQFLLAIALFNGSAYIMCMDNNTVEERLFGIDNTVDAHTIDADLKNMLAVCNDQCTFMKDVTQRCTSKCFMDYGTQRERFLIRKYTTECTARRFNEEWSFKSATDLEGRNLDARNTLKAYRQWERGLLTQQCAEYHLERYAQQLKALERMKNIELDEFKQEHPVLSAGVDAYNYVRGIHKSEK